MSSVKEAILVIEKTVISSFPPIKTVVVLISAFYVFNMHYTVGCNNLYSFFEVMFFEQKKPAKKTRLTGLIARLSS